MKNSGNSRRTFIAGMIAAIGSGLWARTAFAFPPGTQGLVQAATRILHRFGVSVAATVHTAFDRDVLRFTVIPSDEIQYDQIVNSPTEGTTCWITSSFRDFVEFTNFAMSTAQPDLKITSQGGQSMIEILDPQANVQVMIAGARPTSFETGCSSWWTKQRNPGVRLKLVLGPAQTPRAREGQVGLRRNPRSGLLEHGTAPDRLQPPLVPRSGFRWQVSFGVRLPAW